MATPENLNVAAIGQIQAGALAAGNLALIVPLFLVESPLDTNRSRDLTRMGTYSPFNLRFFSITKARTKRFWKAISPTITLNPTPRLRT